MTSGESVPRDDTLHTIATELQKSAAEMERLRRTLGAEKFAQVEGFANRFYEANRRVLDMAHAHGIITDENYEKCLARGNEYTPIGWIINDLLE
jgi:hypothetical protein